MQGFYLSNDILDNDVMTLTVIRKTKLSDFQLNYNFPTTDTKNCVGTLTLTQASKIYKITLLSDICHWGITHLPLTYPNNLEIDYTEEYGLNILVTNNVDVDKVYIYEFSDDIETIGGAGLKLYDANGRLTFNLNTSHLPILGFGYQWSYEHKVDDYQVVATVNIPLMKGNATNGRILNRAFWDNSGDCHNSVLFVTSNYNYKDPDSLCHGENVFGNAIENAYLLDVDADN